MDKDQASIPCPSLSARILENIEYAKVANKPYWKKFISVGAIGLGCILLFATKNSNVDLPIDSISHSFSDQRISNGVSQTFSYIEGSFGAIFFLGVMLACLLSAYFRHFKIASVFLSLAVVTFITRATVKTFFNVESIEEFGPATIEPHFSFYSVSFYSVAPLFLYAVPIVTVIWFGVTRPKETYKVLCRLIGTAILATLLLFILLTTIFVLRESLWLR